MKAVSVLCICGLLLLLAAVIVYLGLVIARR